jgi:hypothetical protein
LGEEAFDIAEKQIRGAVVEFLVGAEHPCSGAIRKVFDSY